MPVGGGDEKKVCCAFDAMRDLRHITVDGQKVAISNLDGIFTEARRHESDGEKAVRKELLRQARAYNYIPEQAERAYEDALWSEYKSSGCKTGDCQTCQE